MNFWNETVTYSEDDFASYNNRLYVSLQDDNLANIPSVEESEWWILHNDPITQVYNALWKILEDHGPLASMVKVGNRIKFTGANRDPIKMEVSTADLPELRIVPLSGIPHIQRDSSGSSLVKRFRIDVSTGDQRVDAILFPVEWELYRALSNWDLVLLGLKWNDKSYVIHARQIDISEGVTDSDLNRGIKGWSILWQCEIEMWFATSDLKGE